MALTCAVQHYYPVRDTRDMTLGTSLHILMVMVIEAWCHSDVTGHCSHDTPGGSQGAVSL